MFGKILHRPSRTTRDCALQRRGLQDVGESPYLDLQRIAVFMMEHVTIKGARLNRSLRGWFPAVFNSVISLKILKSLRRPTKAQPHCQSRIEGRPDRQNLTERHRWNVHAAFRCLQRRQRTRAQRMLSYGAKQPVAGELVPYEPCDATPFVGITLRVDPFQVIE